VDQIQVDVVQPQIFQTQLEVLRYSMRVCSPQLSCYEEVLPLHDAGVNSLLDSLANIFLVLVGEGCVDVAVAYLDGMKDCILDFFRARLPCSWKGISDTYPTNRKRIILPSPNAGISAPVLSLNRLSATAIVVGIMGISIFRIIYQS